MKNNNILERQKELEAELKEDSAMEINLLLEKYKTSLEGLSIVEIEEKQEEYGKNTIEMNNNNSFFYKLKDAFINPFNIVLIIVAIVTFFTDIVISSQKDYATFVLILSAVILSAIISLVQQIKSDNAANKLKHMITNKMDVIRDDVLSVVDVEEIVPGDIVKLSSGDMIPGDIRFIETKDLFIDQASLTGESNPIEKYSTIKNEPENVTDIDNIGFMGTNIVSGSATAVVLKTGNNTYFGNMAKSIYTVAEKNSFEKGVDAISSLLIKFMTERLPSDSLSP